MVDITFLVTSVGTTFGLFLILALSFNMEYGYAGQPNLGKVFFFSVGAYVAGAFTTRVLWLIAGFPADEDLLLGDLGGSMRLNFARANPGIILGLFVLALVIGAIVGGAFGYLASYPALRLRGDFLAIVLIAVGEVSRVLVENFRPIAGGAFNLTGVPNPFIWLPDPRLIDSAFMAVVLTFAGATYILASRLANSPFGRKLKSIRDDELAASVYGKEAPRVKGTILVIGSAMASVGGVLHAFYLQTVSAGNYAPLVTFLVVTMVILGGAANHRGVIVGALLMTLLDLVTRSSFLFIIGVTWVPPFDINYLRYLIVGSLIVLVLLYRPQGLFPERPVATPALPLARKYKAASPVPMDGGGQDTATPGGNRL